MPIFTRDNIKRVDRAQQLVDSISSIQAEIGFISQLMDKMNPRYRPALNKLLKENGMETVDDVIVIEEATKKITQHKKDFEGLLRSLKNIESGLNWGYLIPALLIMAEESVLFLQTTCVSRLLMWYPGATLCVGTVAVVAARFYWKLDFKFAKNLTHVVSALAACTQAAAEGLRLLTSELQKTTPFRQEAIGDLAMSEDADKQICLGIIVIALAFSTHIIVALVGLAVGALFGLFDVLIGADQKKKLVETIHELQELRLEMAFQKLRLINIQSQLELVQDYLDAFPLDSNLDTTSEDVENLISAIKTRCNGENQCLDKLQFDLDEEDRTSTMFYGNDDLHHFIVVMSVDVAVGPVLDFPVI